MKFFAYIFHKSMKILASIETEPETMLMILILPCIDHNKHSVLHHKTHGFCSLAKSNEKKMEFTSFNMCLRGVLDQVYRDKAFELGYDHRFLRFFS